MSESGCYGDHYARCRDNEKHSAPTDDVGQPATDDAASENAGGNPGSHDAQDCGVPTFFSEPARYRAQLRAH